MTAGQVTKKLAKDYCLWRINPPEGAILAVGQVRDAPVVRDGALAVGKKMALTLSCDHRVVDGAVGAAFLAELRALVEHPMRILTG